MSQGSRLQPADDGRERVLLPRPPSGHVPTRGTDVSNRRATSADEEMTTRTSSAKLATKNSKRSGNGPQVAERRQEKPIAQSSGDGAVTEDKAVAGEPIAMADAKMEARLPVILRFGAHLQETQLPSQSNHKERRRVLARSSLPSSTVSG